MNDLDFSPGGVMNHGMMPGSRMDERMYHGVMPGSRMDERDHQVVNGGMGQRQSRLELVPLVERGGTESPRHGHRTRIPRVVAC